jgi:hypothetical protein
MIGQVDEANRTVFLDAQAPPDISTTTDGVSKIACPAGSFGIIKSMHPGQSCEWTAGDKQAFLMGQDVARLLWCNMGTMRVLTRAPIRPIRGTVG